MNSQFTCLVFMIITNFWACQSEAQCSCSGCFDEYILSAGESKTFPTYCSSGYYTVIAFNIASTDGSSFTVTTTDSYFTFPELSTTDDVQCLSVDNIHTNELIIIFEWDSLNVAVTCENYFAACPLQQSIQFACGDSPDSGEEPSSSCDKFRQDCVDKCSTGDYGGIRNKKCSQTNGVITDSSCECNPGSTDAPAVGTSSSCEKSRQDCVDKCNTGDYGGVRSNKCSQTNGVVTDSSCECNPGHAGSSSGPTVFSSDRSSAMPIGAIIGIVVGVVLLGGIFICTIVYYRKSKKFAADDKGYALMSDTGDSQPNDARSFFSSRKQKVSNTTTVVVTQPPQQYQTEPVQLGDI